MIKWVSRVHLGPILYHSETSDFLYFQNQFFDWDFFAASYSKTALVEKTFNSYQMTYIKWLWMHPIVLLPKFCGVHDLKSVDELTQPCCVIRCTTWRWQSISNRYLPAWPGIIFAMIICLLETNKEPHRAKALTGSSLHSFELLQVHTSRRVGSNKAWPSSHPATFNSYRMTYMKWLWMHPIVHFGQTIQHLTNISKSLAQAQFEIEWFIFYASLNYFQDLNFRSDVQFRVHTLIEKRTIWFSLNGPTKIGQLFKRIKCIENEST